MEDIKRYGGLSEKDFYDLLAEIEDSDDELKETEDGAAIKIAIEESQGASERAETDKTNLRRRLKAEQLRQDRIDIQREAFNQSDIALGDTIDKRYIRLLISTLVQEHTRMVNKYSEYINKRITALLKPFIPKRLMACMLAYPNSVKKCPGFMYKASEEYGKNLSFWATPSIPYYVPQGDEVKLLTKHKLEFLHAVDKAVNSYHEHVKKRQDKELKYASLILRRNVCTYFDLLKLNPFWFKVLYDKIKENKV